MATDTLKDYIQLIEAFTSGAMPVSAFEREYIQRFQEDEAHRPPEQFHVLDGLFADVDAYCADPALRGEDDLDEASLRTRAQAVLSRLRELSRVAHPSRWKTLALPFPVEVLQAAAGSSSQFPPVKQPDLQIYTYEGKQILWVELKDSLAPPMSARIHVWGNGREGRWTCPIEDVERTKEAVSVYVNLGTSEELRRETAQALGKLPEEDKSFHFEVELEFADGTDASTRE